MQVSYDPTPLRLRAWRVLLAAPLALGLILPGSAMAQDGIPEPQQQEQQAAPESAPSLPAAGTVQPANTDVNTGGDMETDNITGASGPGSASPVLPHDLSPWGMYQQADIVVKGVMIGLAIASVLTWTIGLAKTVELAAARAAASRMYRTLVRADALEEAQDAAARARSVNAAMVRAAIDEMERSVALPADGVKERALASLSRLEARATRRMTRGMGVLATIGATAPFVGLFGTVWGIMNSFIGIAESQTTNLAVVAPGIAEALLATAIGLVAAIPAVVLYNVFTRSIGGYRAVLADASAEVMRHLSRDLDRRDHPRRFAAAAE